MNLLASHLEVWATHVYAFLEQLNLPSREEYIAAASSALHDVRAASSSSWHLTYLTFRPIFILLGILSHYVAIVLRVIAKHSVAHGWIAAREGYFQIKTATIWFVNFQRDLPRSAKYAELGVIGALVALWLLRRHIQKYRYVERIMAWYREKKRRALNRYRRIVEKVATTSLFLALLLPHLLYILALAGVKRLAPSVVTYLATRTYLNSILCFWHPLYLTVSVIWRLSLHLRTSEQLNQNASDDRQSLKSPGKQSEKGMRRGGLVTPSLLKKQQRHEVEREALQKELEDLLKYWVVYAILMAIFNIGRLLPVIGRVLNITDLTAGLDDTSSTAASAGRWGFRANGRSDGLLSKLRLSGRFVEEIRLTFFVWLRLMPVISFAGSDSAEGPGKGKGKFTAIDSAKHRPLDIAYEKLSPLAISAMNSSAFLTKPQPKVDKDGKSISKNENDSYFSMGVQKLRSLLDLAVMLRVCSKNTQDLIITTFVESSALVPAALTLFMPSYFTTYGVIYVSLIVPAGYSVKSASVLQSKLSNESSMQTMDDASRYLQFWVVHAMVSIFLGSLAPLLAWVPLSTHAIWILWAYVQMESPTRVIYSFVEKELGVLGLLNSKDDDASPGSLDDSAVVRSIRKIISSLPSNNMESRSEIQSIAEEPEDDPATKALEQSKEGAASIAAEESKENSTSKLDEDLQEKSASNVVKESAKESVTRKEEKMADNGVSKE